MAGMLPFESPSYNLNLGLRSWIDLSHKYSMIHLPSDFERL
jgi:hypothetical protein